MLPLAGLKHNPVCKKPGTPSCFFGGNLVYQIDSYDSSQPKSQLGVLGFLKTQLGLRPAIVDLENTPPPSPKPTPAPPVQSTSAPNPIELDLNTPPVLLSDNHIEEFIKKFGEDSRLIWFCKKLALEGKIALVGYMPLNSSTFDSALALTKIMYTTILNHWSEHIPRSKKETTDRIDVLRTFKDLVTCALLNSFESISPSSSDKGKKHAFDQD